MTNVEEDIVTLRMRVEALEKGLWESALAFHDRADFVVHFCDFSECTSPYCAHARALLEASKA